jgi:hypothetical protein
MQATCQFVVRCSDCWASDGTFGFIDANFAGLRALY